MPNSELGQQILAENKALRGQVGAMSTQLDTLEDKGRHTRWIAYVLSLVVAVTVITWGYDRLSGRVDVLRDYQVQNCMAGNETRQLDHDFWTNDILGVIAPADGSAGEKAFAAKIQPKVDARYALRDCTKVAQGKVR